MDSRHLGHIVLEGGAGGGRMDATVEIAGKPVPFRLEIDFPTRFDETVVRKIDIALDSLDYLDDYARTAIMTSIRQAGSASSRLFSAWEAENEGGPGRDEEFVRELLPTFVNLLPDGGIGSLDRVIYTYQLPGAKADEKIVVRFKEGIGPEIDPAPYREFA